VNNFIQTYFKAENSPYLTNTDLMSHRFNIVVHSEGVDIIKIYMYIIIQMMLTGNKKIVVSSPIFNSCIELLDEVNYHLKKVLKFFPDIEITNGQSKVKGLVLSNGSSVHIYKTHYQSYINDDVDLVILMDMAFTINSEIETFFKLVVVNQMAKPDGRFIINSIPNGRSNLFYDIFKQAEQGKNIFKPLRLYYWIDPTKRDYEWIKEKINSIGEDEFDRKFNLSFSTKKKNTSV
jgi:hypothetical protein